MGNLELMMTYAAVLSVLCLLASLWIKDQGSPA
jgi:hypothetical protein